MIKLTITKLEENENYEEEMQDYRSGFGYSNRGEIPLREINKQVLAVAITEEQFDAIRKAVLEVF